MTRKRDSFDAVTYVLAGAALACILYTLVLIATAK